MMTSFLDSLDSFKILKTANGKDGIEIFLLKSPLSISILSETFNIFKTFETPKAV